MNLPAHTPLVLLPVCHCIVDERVFHATPAAYSDALRLAGCQPLLVSAESPGELANPHFPALRPDPMALSGASRRKQIPGSQPP